WSCQKKQVEHSKRVQYAGVMANGRSEVKGIADWRLFGLPAFLHWIPEGVLFDHTKIAELPEDLWQFTYIHIRRSIGVFHADLCNFYTSDRTVVPGCFPEPEVWFVLCANRTCDFADELACGANLAFDFVTHSIVGLEGEIQIFDGFMFFQILDIHSDRDTACRVHFGDPDIIDPEGVV